MNNSPLGLDQ